MMRGKSERERRKEKREDCWKLVKITNFSPINPHTTEIMLQ
jgi:hypothetical protein